jgi:PleD family two-component response regulator
VVATREPGATSTAALAAAADRALYRAKREGRNRVVEAIDLQPAVGLPDA